MIDKFPAELREMPHWVIGTKSKVAVDNKVPINPATGYPASPVDSSTWTTFTAALAARTDACPHIGFVLSDMDPYTIIDLDDPYDPKHNRTDEKRAELAALNEKIYRAFNSYTETSQSGTGVHIIVRGKIPKGVNRDTVEMYCSQRYMICTGNVLKDLPIVDCQDLLDALYKEMESKSKSVELEEVNMKVDDSEIVDMAMAALNGEKFTRLCNGDFSDYPSQSEADFALLSIIAFYTESNEQVRRIFRMTSLGKREKAIKNDRYINFALAKVRAHQIPKVDFSGLSALMADMFSPTTQQEAHAATIVEKALGTSDTTIDAKVPEGAYQHLKVPPTKKIPKIAKKIKADEQKHLFPHGLIGDIAQYIFESSARPVKEISLMTAIGLMSGITGRQYNVSGTGLNHYLIMLAKTGAGKEGIANGIDRIHKAIRVQIPMMDQFSGPSAFASGPAIVKCMSKKVCFLSVLGEFGLTLQEMTGPRAQGPNVTLRKAMLDLYQKSGKESVLRSSVYSDEDKNTQDVQAPSFSMIGESNPDSFFDGLSEAHISDGLIPRFSIREYTGDRPYLNKGHGYLPSEGLTDKMVDLVTMVLTMQSNDAYIDIPLDQNATILSDKFEKDTTDLINKSSNQVLCQLWNRAHLKTLKMAGLIAVGVNFQSPVVTEKEFIWAMAFVKDDIDLLMRRFITGDIGDGESKQEADFIKKVNRYFENEKPNSANKKYHDKNAICAAWFGNNIKQLASFRKDARGGSKAMQVVLANMIEYGMLEEMPRAQALNEFKSSAKVYVLGAEWARNRGN